MLAIPWTPASAALAPAAGQQVPESMHFTSHHLAPCSDVLSSLEKGGRVGWGLRVLN